MAEYTPTPWEVSVDHEWLIGRYPHNRNATNDIASTALTGQYLSVEEAAANAALIVKAVNSHAALVEALEYIIKLDTCISDGGKRHDHGFWAGLAIGALVNAGLAPPVATDPRP